jgi:catechol 2,3-dioxygenase-like lactoylglutathione lyase family enzyme
LTRPPGGYRESVQPASFDHVALWVTDPAATATALVALVPGLREIERTDAFTLLGADAREGKITLFAADGPREAGALEAVVLRTPDVEAALERADDQGLHRDGAVVALADALRVLLVEGKDVDLDGVVLTVADAAGTALAFLRLGLREDGARLVLGRRSITVRRGRPGPTARPLLNHLALRVTSLDEAQAEALMLGFEVAREVDAANTRAVFLRGPEGIEIELVEHKPSFALV